jgi:hypothetical protein
MGIDGHIIDLDSRDTKQCSICRAWFWRAQLRSNTYCAACNNDYQRWRQWIRRVDLTNLYYIVNDVSVQTFRELYMSGMLGDDGFEPWVDKWRPGFNDHVVPLGAIAVTSA